MAQFIDNLNILSTSTVTYTVPSGWESWEYNNRYYVSPNANDDYSNISMLNNQYSVKYYNNQNRFQNNPVIINRMVVSTGTNKAFPQSPFGKQNFIYAAPRLINGQYVEQNPFSEISYEIDPNRANYARPVIDGTVYNTYWTKFANSEQGAYLYSTPTIGASGVTGLYDAGRLEGLAIYQYSAYPTFAQNLKNMSHGAARVAWGQIFYNYLGSQGYQPINLFSEVTTLDGLWLMPFASDDEYNAAYAELYKWSDDDIQIIDNWRRS